MNGRAREAGLFWPALWRLALAGGVFLVVYNACNHYTATRTDAGVWMWEWERHIPFVPELVVPYWSLDLFFCGVFFICGSRAELNLLTRRLVAVTLASGLCYLLFPLRFALPRPVPAGWTAPFFRALYFGDLPYNLTPSLHIGLRSLIWVFYGAHLTGGLRRAVKAWFMVIGLSTLLVWQHHFIDVAGGFVMGWAVAAVFPDPRQTAVRTPSRRLALYYGAGAAGCAVLSWGWFGFAWPAVALAIVAAAYAAGRPHLWGKENGTLSPAAEWCLLPVLLVASVVQRRWLRRQPAWREVTPGVAFGRRLTGAEAEKMAGGGHLAVLDLTAEANAPVAFRERAHYYSLPLLDLVEPPPEAVAIAVEYIRVQRERPQPRRVYIHCQLGLRRSAAVAAHWMVAAGAAANPAEARELIKAQAPEVLF